MKVWSFLFSALQKGQKAVLLYVLDSQGSSPGRRGFKMGLAENGQFEGTIGGGIMEVKLLELAKDKLQKRDYKVVIKQQYHDKRHGKNQSGMICSGEQKVAIIPLRSVDLGLLENIVEHETLRLQLNEEGLKILNPGEKPSGEELDIQAKPRVHIFGGGHVGLALSQVLSLLDFYIVVYDDRPELNTLAQNHFADESRIIDYHKINEAIDFESEDRVVIVTFSYRTDKILLKQLYDKTFAFLGMMGSEAKIETLLRELALDGIGAEKLTALHAPIGIPIFSKTAMEIAVSIAGQIIKEKNKNLPTGRSYDQ